MGVVHRRHDRSQQKILGRCPHWPSPIQQARESNTVHYILCVCTQLGPQIDNFLRERITSSLDLLNTYLHSKTYLVGHRITVADIALATIVSKLVSSVLGKEERTKFANVTRHFETIYNQPKLKAIFGEYTYAEKAQQYVAPQKEKKAPIAAAVAAVKEKIAPKPKAAPAAEDDDDEPLVPEEPKAKNPLDELPKSTLNLEDWKRAYSNLDTRGPKGSLEWFYEK